jgi:protein O-mannosyl-transferase
MIDDQSVASGFCTCPESALLIHFNVMDVSLIRNQRQAVLASLVLLVLLILAYSPVWNAGFVWDDAEQLVNNQAVKDPNGLPLIWTTVGLSPQFYPLTFSAFWLQHQLWGMNPRGYHVVNVLLMWVVALLLWRLFRRLGSPVAWWGACLFALHPVNVMSVAWVTELKNVLSGVFIVSSVLAYLPVLERRRGLSWRRLTGVFILYMLAMFAKTASSFIPAALLLLHFWKGVRVSRRSIVLIVAMTVFALAMSVITVRWETMTKFAVTADFELNGPQRWVIFGQVFWIYLYKALLPVNLSFFYERWEVPLSPSVGLMLLPLLAVAAMSLLWVKRKSWGRGPWAVMMHYMLTTSALILMHVLFMTRYTWLADHWQFFGLLGLIPALVNVLYERLSRLHNGRPLFYGVVGSLAILFLVGSRAESAKYQSLEGFYLHVINDNPKSWLAYNNLGRIYDERGDKLRAIEYYEKSLAIRPDNFEAVNNYGCTLADLGRFAEAEKHFRNVLTYRPDLPGVFNNLGRVLALQDRLDEADRVYQAGLKYKPDDVVALEALGVVKARMSQLPDAAELFSRMLAIKPGDQQAHAYLGQVYSSMGQYARAKAHFEKSFDLISGEPDHLNSYAWAVASLTNPTEKDLSNAVSAVNRAISIAPDTPWYWGTLAAVQAKGGNFEDAVASSDKAMALAAKQGNENFVKDAGERKKLYQQKSVNP